MFDDPVITVCGLDFSTRRARLTDRPDFHPTAEAPRGYREREPQSCAASGPRDHDSGLVWVRSCLLARATQVLKWKARLKIRSGPRGRNLWDFLDDFVQARPFFSSIPFPLLIHGESGMNQF